MNQKRRNETARIRYAKNAERLREYGRKKMAEYRKANPEVFAKRRALQKQRERARGIRPRVPQQEWRETITVELIRRDGFGCGICGKPLDGPIHIDHVVSVRRGGNHNLENLRLSHAFCNFSRTRRGFRAGP